MNLEVVSTHAMNDDAARRRPNGYFIYATVEGVSFQPRDVPTEPLQVRLVSFLASMLMLRQ